MILNKASKVKKKHNLSLYSFFLSVLVTFSHVHIALRSGTGASVVNGRWVVDPPGDYQAGGTTFTYTRPRAQADGEGERGESLNAPGPTTTLLQLYVSTGTQEGIYFKPLSKHEPGHKLGCTQMCTCVNQIRSGLCCPVLCQDPPDMQHYFSVMAE